MEAHQPMAPNHGAAKPRTHRNVERGASLIEYALLITTVAVVSTLALGLVRNATAGAFEVAEALDSNEIALGEEGWRRTVRAEDAGAVTFVVLDGRIRVADVVARGGWEHETSLTSQEIVVTFEGADRSVSVSAKMSDGDLYTQVVAVAAAYAAG